MRTYTFYFALVAGLVLFFSLSACTSTGPVEPVEPGTVEMDRNNLPSAPDPEPPDVNPSARAVAGLVNESERSYQRGDWEAAIATAERALRIDRRQADVYLIIAKSYRALGDSQQALQFVQQGMRYVSDPNSAVGRELDWLSQALR